MPPRTRLVPLFFVLAVILPFVVLNASPPEVLLKKGSCPGGYHTEGKYCVANRQNSRTAIPKEGSCPGGYHTEGRYCVSNRP
jgi:hypothetical protein